MSCLELVVKGSTSESVMQISSAFQACCSGGDTAVGAIVCCLGSSPTS